MTSYHGGKQRIGEKISETILRIVRETGFKPIGYLEPFCGMLGVYRHIYNKLDKCCDYKAGDLNKSVIMMWKALQKGWIPPNKCSKKRFLELRGNGESSAEKGFIGHACAFRGIYFITYKHSTSKNRLEYSKNKVLEISKQLKNVKFVHSDFTHWSNLRGYIIYCDPPYFSCSKFLDEFNTHRNFDYSLFYKWAEEMSHWNLVFISERAELPYTLIGEFNQGEKLYIVNKLD